MKLLMALPLAVAFGVLYAAHDGLLIKGYRKKINHGVRLLVRSGFVLHLAYLVSGSTIELISTVPALFFAFHIPFDPILNISIGREWHYLGTTAKSDRIIRKISPRKPGMVSLITESILFIISIIVYILI